MTDRDRLIEIINDWARANNDGAETESIADYLLANGVIVPVRCKDCEFVKSTEIKLNGKDLRSCTLYKRPCYDNDFCSRGVLKEREG